MRDKPLIDFSTYTLYIMKIVNVGSGGWVGGVTVVYR